jgi:hypothetical protein
LRVITAARPPCARRPLEYAVHGGGGAVAVALATSIAITPGLPEVSRVAVNAIRRVGCVLGACGRDHTNQPSRDHASSSG